MPFPFLKLPGEIKNMIYRFSLGQGAVSKHCGHPLGQIVIENLSPRNYNSQSRRGRIRFRKPYPAMVRGSHEDCCGHIDPFDYFWESRTTTYTLPQGLTIPGLGLLAVNHQIREEVLPIFYGENSFSFVDMSAVAPFFRDRPAVVRQALHRISLQLELMIVDEQHCERQAEWVKAFLFMARHLKLRDVEVRVVNLDSITWDSVDLEDAAHAWVRAMAQIKDLDQFAFHMLFEDRGSCIEAIVDDEYSDDEAIEDQIDYLDSWMTKTVTDYEQYIRSRTLKKTQSTIDEWLDDHVCDLQCDKVCKGREATRQGLPRSNTRGEWTLPDLDLDTLYGPYDLDDLQDEEEYSDAHESDDKYHGENDDNH
ncbi:MAG: hypothetical protein LQ343_005679 [Gyalolechia ehrenbergii]|nr:MAG: hypothetical protein LQ343_005679 [Gyalolechia ehrenbergii]